MNGEQLRRRRLIRSVKRLHEHLKDGVPDLILAIEVNSIWQQATALFGAVLYAERARRDYKTARKFCGLCENCPNEVTGEQELCESCQRISDESVAELAEEVDEEFLL